MRRSAMSSADLLGGFLRFGFCFFLFQESQAITNSKAMRNSTRLYEAKVQATNWQPVCRELLPKATTRTSPDAALPWSAFVEMHCRSVSVSPPLFVPIFHLRLEKATEFDIFGEWTRPVGRPSRSVPRIGTYFEDGTAIGRPRKVMAVDPNGIVQQFQQDLSRFGVLLLVVSLHATKERIATCAMGVLEAGPGPHGQFGFLGMKNTSRIQQSFPAKVEATAGDPCPRSFASRGPATRLDRRLVATIAIRT